jgi:acyl carrier protein
MDKQEVAARIAKIFEEDFEIEPEKLVPEAHIFTDLGLDSIDMVELMIALQKAFTIQIQDSEEARAIRTLDQLCDFVLKIIENPSPQPPPTDSAT